MMQLKKAMLEIVAGDGGECGVLFEAPPQGNPRISEAHADQLAELCEQVRARTQGGSFDHLFTTPSRAAQLRRGEAGWCQWLRQPVADNHWYATLADFTGLYPSSAQVYQSAGCGRWSISGDATGWAVGSFSKIIR